MQPFLRDEVDIVVNLDRTIELVNELGDVFVVNEALYYDLKKGGKDLANLPDDILKELNEGKIIQKSRFVRDKEGSRVILIRFSEGIKRYRNLCIKINKYLPIISAISFFLGIFLAIITHCNYCIENVSFFEFISIVEITSIVHEFFHLCSGIALDIDISEFGALVCAKYLPIPIGYYVKPKRDYKLISKHTNFYLAGIESNMVAFFIFIVLSCTTTSMNIYATYRFSALMELLLVVTNALPANKMDGDLALSAYFNSGKKPISEISKKLLFTKEGRTKLKDFGDGRTIATCLFIFIYSSKILYYIILVLSFVIPIKSLIPIFL